MKIAQKQKYLAPKVEIMYVQNESLLAGASNTVEKTSGLKKEDYTNSSAGEYNGGSAEW